MQQLTELNIEGNTTYKLVVERANEDGGMVDRESTGRDYLIWSVMKGGGVGVGGGDGDEDVDGDVDGDSEGDKWYLTKWEALDEPASRNSISAGGPAVGYGPGISASIDTFNSSERSNTKKETGAKLLTADGRAAGETVTNTKQRASRAEKCENKKVKEEARAMKEERKATAVDRARAEAVKEDREEVMMCPNCGLEYMQNGWWLRHLERCPGISKQSKGSGTSLGPGFWPGSGHG